MFLRFWYYDIKKSAKRACLININHAPCQLLSDSGMQTFLLSIILFCRLQVEPVRTAQLKVTSLWLGLIYIVKSKGFKKVMSNDTIRQEVVKIWIFVFPAKENSTYWEASTEKPVQIALTFLSSFQTFASFFSAAP